MISIQDLVVKHSKAITNLSLEIGKKGCFAILGPNGAGKTTLVNVICGLLQYDSGNVLVGGINPNRDINRTRSLIGLVT